MSTEVSNHGYGYLLYKGSTYKSKFSKLHPKMFAELVQSLDSSFNVLSTDTSFIKTGVCYQAEVIVPKIQFHYRYIYTALIEHVHVCAFLLN